ncbi:SPOR domain-containing protein [Veronia pacifica]|uniref:Cell division protein DedD n=1 Tax=Veronia pacifica TaxID=1080227 RepID=A0A1C3ERB6_9GAMM|nr:SPOR domain-containing protein [Veronia pacifica]ODA35748.1 cell division protein DedD [Veronia pacifica]
MATQFQNRLVGTVMLVCLGVIFLPDVLDGKKEKFQEDFDAIPLREPIDKTLLDSEIKLPDTGGVVEDIDKHADHLLDDRLATVTLGDTEEKVSAQSPKPAVVQKPNAEKNNLGLKDSAWVLRLGTFRNIDNAKNLVTKLRNKGYPAHIYPKDVRVGQLARVEVGPDLSKDKLQGMRADLESLTGLKGQLVKFNPLNL